jgi:hypothetical protein
MSDEAQDKIEVVKIEIEKLEYKSGDLLVIRGGNFRVDEIQRLRQQLMQLNPDKKLGLMCIPEEVEVSVVTPAEAAP